MYNFKKIILLGGISLILMSLSVHAAAPSPQMIEQFKNLPIAQQKALAKQYGISLPSENVTETITNPQLVSPRKANNLVIDQSEGKSFNQATKSEVYTEAQESKESNELRRFGYDLFAGSPTTFAPVSDVPVPADYMMGPGDVIKIDLYGKESQSYKLIVDRSGAIQFPQLGPISVIGMSFSDVQDLIKDNVTRSMIGQTASITLGELRSIRIFIAGDAYKPGSYTVSSLSTLTQALFVSGGVNEIGSLRNIQLKRKGQVVAVFDIYDLLLRGDTSNDVRLYAGDVVFIPTAGGSVSVTGEVRRPAIYELKNNETMADIIKMASGLAPGAFPEASVVERFSKQAVKTVVNVDLTQESGLSTKVRDGDILNVKSASAYIENAVTLVGAVVRPGKVQFTSNLHIRDFFPSVKGYLTADADLTYSLLIREINQNGDIEVYQFAIGEAIAKRESKHNLRIKPNDAVIIFDVLSRETLLKPILSKLKEQARTGRAAKLVEIKGSVRFSGAYPLAINANIKQLVVAAGGLEEGAYTLAAELTRHTVNDNAGVSIEQLRLSLEKIMASESNIDWRLQSRDILTVRMLPDWHETKTVTIRGEVMFPGAYTIQRAETLKDVIYRAGGYTQEAELKSAVFLRKSIQQKEQQELTTLANDLRRDIAAKSLSSDSQGVSHTDAQLMLADLANVQVQGRLVIDLPALEMGMEDANVDLENGDVLYVPNQNKTVSVLGQVQHPSSHRFKPGITLEQYIEMAGGSKKRADESRIYLLKANGSVVMPSRTIWFSSATPIESGDSIIVPLDTEYKNGLSLWAEVTQIIFNSAVALATITAL